MRRDVQANDWQVFLTGDASRASAEFILSCIFYTFRKGQFFKLVN